MPGVKYWTWKLSKCRCGGSKTLLIEFKKREPDRKWEIKRRWGSSVERQEKDRLKCCLATKHPEDCTVLILLLLYFALLGHSPPFFLVRAAGVKPWRCQWRCRGEKTPRQWLHHYSHGLKEQLSGSADMNDHVLSDFIIFCQELQQNPPYLCGKYLSLQKALNQAQVWERKKGEFCPWAYLCRKDI